MVHKVRLEIIYTQFSNKERDFHIMESDHPYPENDHNLRHQPGLHMTDLIKFNFRGVKIFVMS